MGPINAYRPLLKRDPFCRIIGDWQWGVNAEDAVLMFLGCDCMLAFIAGREGQPRASGPTAFSIVLLYL